jgi:hypothetical protein
VLWADIDHPDSDRLTAALPVAPGIIVTSGSAGHRHLYWPLTQPLSPTAAQHANRVLAHALAGDHGAVLNPAAILRPPGTSNYKHQPPSPVVLEHLAPRAHPLAHILRGLPQPQLRPRPAPRHPATTTADPLHAIAPTDYIQALTGRQPDRDGKLHCPFHDERTPSLHAYPDPQRGWHCYGCGRGGDVYAFASALWNIPTRGADFLALRQRLHQQLLNTSTPTRGTAA